MIVKAAHRRPEGPVWRLTACAVSPFGTAYHLSPASGGTTNPQTSNHKSLLLCHFEGRKRSPKISPHYAARRKWGYVSRRTANLTSEV